MKRRKLPVDDGFRRPGDFGQGDRFPRGFAESRVPQADASYQGYGAYASLDGSRVEDSEYAELDYLGRELEPSEPDTELEPELAALDHTGRGPRGYRRSDDSIRDDLHVVLTAHGEIDASDVEVLVANGEVLVRGTVLDRATKRLIEDIAYGVSGVRDVNNALRIGLPGHPPERPPVRTQLADEDVARRPWSTVKDDHPSRRDAWATRHLRDQGEMQDQFDRSVDRARLGSHDHVGPHDTSAGEHTAPPDAPLLTPGPRTPRTVEEEMDLEELDVEGLEEEGGGAR